jgi:hypothetical protein
MLRSRRDWSSSGSHPNAPKAIGSLPIPDSFADEEYHGIDAFVFVNKSGQRQAVRYVIAPEKLVHITPEEAAKLPLITCLTTGQTGRAEAAGFSPEGAIG